MHAKVAASVAVLGLSAFAAARPAAVASSSTSSASHSFTPSVASSTAKSSSHSSSAAAKATAVSRYQYTKGSKPYKNGQEGFEFPLADGFPNVSPAEIENIEFQAHGNLSNAPPPSKLAPDTIVSNAFVEFNELFEVAFFTELVYNITNNKPGFQHQDIPGDRDEILAVLKVHLAQEELHVLNAKKVVDKFGSEVSKTGIQPCEYIFPVSHFNDSIGLANRFTDAVLSTLPDIITILAADGDGAATRGVGAVIGQEGEQNGFYRGLLGKPEAQLPFKTQGAREFAFNAILQNFVVPGSCGNLDILEKPYGGAKALREFSVLNLVTPESQLSVEHDTQVVFSVPGAKSNNAPAAQSFVQTTNSDADKFFITYLNQVNVPVSIEVELEPASDLSGSEIKVNFPGKTNFLSGLTIAALTKGNGPFATPDDVAAATIAGPALIEVELPLV